MTDDILFIFRFADEPQYDSKEDQDVLEYMASLKRDQEMERVANELKQKRGTDSFSCKVFTKVH